MRLLSGTVTSTQEGLCVSYDYAYLCLLFDRENISAYTVGVNAHLQLWRVMQYTVIGSPHCCAFHIKHNLQSSIVSDTDRSSLWKREHDLGLVLRNIPVKGLQTIKRTCHILSARRVEFPYQLKVYEGSVFPEGVSFHHSFTANFSNVFNIFHENVYI